jgi:DNA repair exonuclease SbcCD ATPase subunit
LRSNLNEQENLLSTINQQTQIYIKNKEDLTNSLVQDNSLTLRNKLKEEELSLTKKIEELSNSLTQRRANLIILDDKIKNKTEAQAKQKTLQVSLEKLQESLLINQIIADASGPNGVPNMIIYNLLDDLQVYINNWLSKLRNNLEFKFVVSKVKSDSSEVDTFDCLYYSRGEEFSFKELSGGQKHIIKLAVKMGFVDLLEEKFNMSIGMLCFDEVDERLDKSASDALTSLIKILEKKYKIFVITHKDTLQTKFLHNILVTQDDDGSTAVLRNNV